MKIVLAILGVVLILIGILTVFLPLPIGIVSMILGLAILVSVNKSARNWVRSIRKRWKPVDDAFDKAEEILPPALSKPLHETDPDHPDDEDDDTEQTDKRSESASSSMYMSKCSTRTRTYHSPSRPLIRK